MKTKIIIALMIFGITFLSGCRDSKTAEKNQDKTVEESKDNKEDEEENEMQAYRTPTEKEMEILEGCNLSEDYMTEIKEKGMSMSVQSFVDTAQIMLNYLEEKYDEEFTVVGGEIPGVISGDYMIFAKATTGDCTGERFEVYYLVDEDGNGYCEDGYFAILKRMEVQEYIQNISEEAGTDMKVIASLAGTVGKEATKEATIEEIETLNKNRDIRIYIYGFARPEMTEEEFQHEAEKLEECLGGTNFTISYLARRLLSNETFDRLESWSDVENILLDPYDKEEKYDLSYEKYIK